MYWTLLAFSGANCCCNKVDAAWTRNPNLSDRGDQLASKITSLPEGQVSYQLCHKLRVTDGEFFLAKNTETTASTSFNCNAAPMISGLHYEEFLQLLTSEASPGKSCDLPLCQQSSQVSDLSSQLQSVEVIQLTQAPQSNSTSSTDGFSNTSQRSDPPQLEGQPDDFPKPSPPVEQRLLEKNERQRRLERLLQILRQNQQPQTDSDSLDELGRLLVRPRQVEQVPPPPERPVARSKPIGYLQARLGFFYTNNIFSTEIAPIEDGLYYAGLMLASVPIRLTPKTYIYGSVDGNLLRYLDQSKFDYNQLRFNLSLYRQLTPKMYGEFGWINQQLYYARSTSDFNSGERFLNENSLRLSIGRRDSFTPRLVLDSIYELRVSFADPPDEVESRDRLSNFLWISLNYFLQRSFQVGGGYQFSFSDFTQRDRQDLYHRLFGQLIYGISDYTNISVQGGITLGGSTVENIDFDGWFFTVNYNFELGRF